MVKGHVENHGIISDCNRDRDGSSQSLPVESSVKWKFTSTCVDVASQRLTIGSPC